MQGIVFDQLREFAATLGDGAWEHIRRGAGFEHQVYLVTENYPDEDLEALLVEASARTGRTRDELLTGFGRFVVPGLLSIYGVLLDKRWGLLDTLLNTERVIHRVVRLRDPDADPPRLHITPHDRGSAVVFEYSSPRHMCAFGKGIIEGLAAHYDSGVVLTDLTCMNHGDATCRILVDLNPG